MSFQTNNFLHRNKFALVIPSFEGVRFLANEVAIPPIELPSVKADSPLSRMAFAGDKASFGLLSFRFFVDEDLINYKSVYDWLMGIGYVESNSAYTDYQALKEYEIKLGRPLLGEQDISVMILDSKDNPIASFDFRNAIPISLSMNSPLETGVSAIDAMTASVTFDYDFYEMKLLDV